MPKQTVVPTTRHLVALALATALVLTSGLAFAGGRKPMALPGSGVFAAAWKSHPVVGEVAAAKALPLLARERALSDAMPLDRALAVVDAVPADDVRRLALGDALVRALRARHSIGPSGALLGKPIPFAQLTAREALLLGWLRAVEVGADVKALAKVGTSIRDAGALQLLRHAGAKAPDAQAPALALALVESVAAKGKARCEAWLRTQRTARAGRSASVPVAAAEGAVAAVARLGKACKSKDREAFADKIRLPPPATEAVPGLATGDGGRRGPPRPTQRGGRYARGIAHIVMAPVYRAYLADPAIAAIDRRERLDEVKMVAILARDPNGDLSIAALNASILGRRVDFDDNLEIAWLAVLRRHGMLDAPHEKARTLPVSALTATEAMALAYAKCVAGEGEGAEPAAPAVAAWDATPLQLFEHARTKLPGNAVVGPLMATAHRVDRAKAADACAAAPTIDAALRDTSTSRLAPPARDALLAALREAKAACTGTPPKSKHP